MVYIGSHCALYLRILKHVIYVRLLIPLLSIDRSECCFLLCEYCDFVHILKKAVIKEQCSRGSLVKAMDLHTAKQVQLPLVPVRATGSGRKGIQPELLLCTSKSPSFLPW